MLTCIVGDETPAMGNAGTKGFVKLTQVVDQACTSASSFEPYAGKLARAVLKGGKT